MPYRMNIQEVVQETYSDLDKGLSEQEAAARLRDQGKNELLKKKKDVYKRQKLRCAKSMWSRLKRMKRMIPVIGKSQQSSLL